MLVAKLPKEDDDILVNDMDDTTSNQHVWCDDLSIVNEYVASRSDRDGHIAAVKGHDP